MPVTGPRTKDVTKSKKKLAPAPSTPLEGIEEHDSEHESWEEVQKFQSTTDVEMTSESEPEAYLNQGEVDAAAYLTKMYNDLMLKQGLPPEDAFGMMMQHMQSDDQTRMLYKWDNMGRQ